MIGKVLSKLLCGLFAVLFVMAVLLHGTDTQYSPWAHFTTISEELEGVPSVQEVSDVWTKESYSYGYWHKDPSLPKGGEWRIKTVKFGIDHKDNDMLKFFSEIAAFFQRLYKTLEWGVEWLGAVFRMLYTLLPWNGLVEVEKVSVIGEVM